MPKAFLAQEILWISLRSKETEGSKKILLNFLDQELSALWFLDQEIIRGFLWFWD